MAIVRLWQRFETTIDGTGHSGGSLFTSHDITTTTDQIVNTTVTVTTTPVKLVDADDYGDDPRFSFLWVENEGPSGLVDIELVVSPGGSDDTLVLSLLPGERLVFPTTLGKESGTLHQFDGAVSEIKQVWAKGVTDVSVRVVATI